MSYSIYRPSDYGKEEEEMMRKFFLQYGDAKHYFLSCIRPRLDRAYKLYISYNGDRSLEIKSWQANVFIPYIQAVVETMMPRILDARPDFSVQSRNEESQLKANLVQSLCDYTWEKARGDAVMEESVRSALIFGISHLQVFWKRDVREQEFLSSKNIDSKKLKWEKKKQVFYDAPTFEAVDNYQLWYDWHNVSRESKQFWFRRLILTGQEIERRYPSADPKRLEMALSHGGGDLADYAAIKNQVRLVHYYITKGADYRAGGQGGGPWGGMTNSLNIYMSQSDPSLKMHEVLEWWRPFDDKYAVMVNYVPVLRGGQIPMPYDFKEAPFIDIPYLRAPFEYEGYGIPMILENPQIMLNAIKNQRLDATTLGIHKMWIVNPLANINKEELVTRPFGIIYSTDPNGVREVQFSDIKSSAYQEEDSLKSDMRYASGVDDFSMGSGAAGQSATAVRHLRESTLERVRLFVNHMGDGLSILLRFWIDMYRQFQTDDIQLRIVGEDGKEEFPLVTKDDLKGEYEFQAAVLPSVAGQDDVNKKQGMDLFQLLINLPFVDPKKLTQKVLHYWDWNLETITSDQAGQPGQPGADGTPVDPNDPMAAMMTGAGQEAPSTLPSPFDGLPPETVAKLQAMMGGSGNPGESAAGPSPFAEASAPIDIGQGAPPTAHGLPTTNPRGLNRTGKVNTNISSNGNSSTESALLNRTFSLQ